MLRALALPPHEGVCLGGSIEWGNASIIAPGREGSQLGGADAQLCA